MSDSDTDTVDSLMYDSDDDDIPTGVELGFHRDYIKGVSKLADRVNELEAVINAPYPAAVRRNPSRDYIKELTDRVHELEEALTARYKYAPDSFTQSNNLPATQGSINVDDAPAKVDLEKGAAPEKDALKINDADKAAKINGAAAQALNPQYTIDSGPVAIRRQGVLAIALITGCVILVVLDHLIGGVTSLSVL